ncbi:hypothetical protein [Rhodovulum sp. 12E13]|uniref:hypothetical protein n=1 Tax=Rhodovulum sp. 12E13 TaxID=2203891 RepID=UPI0011C07BAF|nr:hypothetical protein [Rhodovulum sp. 12E13]
MDPDELISDEDYWIDVDNWPIVVYWDAIRLEADDKAHEDLAEATAFTHLDDHHLNEEMVCIAAEMMRRHYAQASAHRRLVIQQARARAIG